jgi:PAS domain S-box-containing protein
MKDGSFRWHLSRGIPQRDEQNEIINWFGTATDIHDVKVAQEQIKEREKRFRSLAENSPDIITRHDKDFRYLYISPQVEKVTGLKPESFLGKTYRDIGWPENICSFFDEQLTHVFKTGEYHEVDFQMHMNDEYILSRLVPEFDEQGEVESVLIISTSITERKKAETKLQYLAALTHSINDAVVGTDTERNIINWNSGAERTYGWKAEEALGRKAHEILQTRFFSAADDDSWQKGLNEKGNWQGEVIQKHKDGRDLIIHASIALVRDNTGTNIGGVGVNRDITDEKRKEEKLRESEERFRSLIETLPQVVWLNNDSGELEYINREWTNYTGQTLEEAKLNAPSLIHPDDQETVWAKWKKTQDIGGDWKQEYRLLGKDGNYRWFAGSMLPLRNPEGKIVKYIGAATDIHEQKILSEKLEQLVADRTKELQRSNEDLQQFAHVASHDLKEPVRKVRTFIDRLNMEFKEQLPERAKNYVEKIEKASERMYSMIEGVLLYSSISGTEQAVEQVDLNKTLENIVSDLEIAIQHKNALVQYDHLPTVIGSPILLHQLFYNLINNALKFAKTDEAPIIQITSMITMQKAVIHVQDNGIGFDNIQNEKIFKPFSRLNSKEQYEGTGLGLALCQKIVERHHGSIKATGKKEAGAVFTIELPMVH